MSQQGGSQNGSIDWTQWVPIFPLPNAVLMPRHILPLHVFEPRYRAMTHDALTSGRLIGIALLKPGYETKYHTLEAEIHSVVGVGRIRREERLPDGRYNFLLQGLTRARILDENRKLQYRRARLEPIAPQPAPCEVELNYRMNLKRLLSSPPLRELAIQANWLGLFDCPDLSFSDLLDVLAAAVFPCSEEKQTFLEEPRVAKRAQCLCAMLEMYREQAHLLCDKSTRARSWPPINCEN